MLNPDGERHHSFSATWSGTGEPASMRNGSGDEFDIVFSPAGEYIRGFDHESPMSPSAHDVPWPGVVDSVPGEFRHCVAEPAFTDEGVPTVTARAWRPAEDDHWRTGAIDFPEGHPDPDGAGWLFRLLCDGTAEAFHDFAEDHCGTRIGLAAVRRVYALRPLGRDTVRALNPAASPASAAREAAAIGYPVDPELPSSPAGPGADTGPGPL
ncbi:hypothetical protein [Streptomyces sp. CAU 1734]|uniref:hypothetical protein n=1 Tax=Streptomyces sp. CAU 1734 TaxID=3140360 RepID=UPI00326052F3